MGIRLGLLSTAAIALMLAAPAFAQQTTRVAPGANNPSATATAVVPQQQLSRADLDFVKKAAEGGMAEVELGKVAQQNGEDQQVKQFGARMRQDHSSANQQLESIASQKGVQLPKQLDAKDQKELDRLSQLKGVTFDRAYMRMMTQDHDKDVKEFQHEAQAAKDPDIKNFAQQTLSVIQQHDQMAHEISRTMTATGSSQQRR
jgi:putative membrane protein